MQGAEPFDVAIVGFGPSGAVAAALLGQAGCTVWVGDRIEEVYPKPRAIALDHEILRVFQQLGIAEAVAPYIEPFTDSCYYGVGGELIRRMTMLAPPYPQAWMPSVVFNQPPVEEVLRAAVRRLPTVSVELGVEVRGLEQSEQGVSLALAGGRQVRARYVIACDGASSTVRGLLDIGLEDLGFDEPWLVVDVLANEFGLAKLPRTSVQYCNPARPSTYVIGTKNHRRWEISLHPDEDPVQAATPEGTWALLRPWITPEDGALWRQASYRFHALVARRWRQDRVFIAGDAAHQQPPFLGQGMCQGVRDVVNLTWKLEAVLRGLAGTQLLDSYALERSAHVRELTQRLRQIGAVICERDPQKARERDARLLEQAGGAVPATPRQDVLPPLTQGALASRACSARGTLFPQPWLLQSGRRIRMDEWLAPGWRLVTTDPAVPSPEPVRPPGLECRSLGQLHEADGVLAAWFARHGCRAALVRPDHYVFGTAVDDPRELTKLVSEAGALFHQEGFRTGDTQ